jgi:hypothetical protein
LDAAQPYIFADLEAITPTAAVFEALASEVD